MGFFKSIMLIAMMISVVYYNQAESNDDFSLDFDIIDASYSSDKNILSYETKAQVGRIFAKNFVFDSDAFSFYIQNQNGVEITLSVDAKKFYFEKSDVGYAQGLNKLSFLEKISFFNAKNLMVKYNEEEFLVNQEYLIFRSNGANLYEFSNFNFHCPFNSTHKFGTNYEKFLYHCMNGASLEKANHTLPSPMVKIENEKMQFKTLVDRFSTSANKLSTLGSSLELQSKSEKSDTSLSIQDFALDCSKEEFTGTNITTPLMRGCYNSFKYTNTDLSLVSKERASGKSTSVSLKRGSIETLPAFILMSGDHLQYKGVNPKDEKSAYASIKTFSARCKKKAFSRENLNQNLIDGCYDNLNLVSEELIFNTDDQKLDKKSKTTVRKSTVVANDNVLSLNAINLDMQGDENEVSVKNLVASCSKVDKDKSLGKRMLKNCLSKSSLVSTEVKYKSLKDKSSSEIHKLDFAFLDSLFTLTANKIVYNSSEDAKISVNNANLKCSRASITKEKIDAQELIKGCFNSSNINISSIEYLDPSNNAKLDISSIALDKNRIDVVIPSATYDMNKAKYDITNMNIHCSLSADFDVVKSKDWRKIVSNCLRDLRIGLGKVRDSKSGGILKINKYDDVDLVVNKNAVVLTVKAKNTIGITAKAKVTGKVYFKDNDTKMVFEIDKTNIKLFSTIPIPSESIFAGILRSLVKDKRITQNGNVITVDLSGNKK